MDVLVGHSPEFPTHSGNFWYKAEISGSGDNFRSRLLKCPVDHQKPPVFPVEACLPEISDIRRKSPAHATEISGSLPEISTGSNGGAAGAAACRSRQHGAQTSGEKCRGVQGLTGKLILGGRKARKRAGRRSSVLGNVNAP